MDDSEWLAGHFERHRPHLRAVAYRMLGSLTEADDAVQDAWLRLSRAGAEDVENLGGWLTTIVARVCLNMLRSRSRRREEPLAAHLPDPVISPEARIQPEEEALLADSVGLALLVVLDTLTPDERLAFVLHDMFELPFKEIAAMVGRTPAAAKQLASRARRRGPAPARRLPTPIPPGSVRWSRPSSPPRAEVTSTRSSPCSTLASWREQTLVPGAPQARWSPAARMPSPGMPSWARLYRPHTCTRPW
jgi:RNA polymerase sigma-70 factor (ECF subfamily)